MRQSHILLGGIAAVLLAVSPASAQVKVGIVLPFSGQFADAAKQLDDGIKLYVKQHGDTVAGKNLQFFRKDVGGINPPVAKRLAQELIVRDKVDMLAGWVLTPNAIAGCGVSKEAKKFMVIMNAATSIITLKSPYCVRSSLTLPMVTETLGEWAAKNGVKTAYTMTSDYAPGHDAEQGFIRGFKKGGGKILGSVRMPVRNPDFSAFVQKAKDVNPQAIFVFIPGGAQPAALAKAFAERGIDAKTILGTGEVTSDEALKNMGDAAIGIITAWHFSHNHQSKITKDFVTAFNKDYGRNPDFFAVGGYDGMHLIYETLKKTKGKTDAAALTDAAKGLKWESPRGPMMIDPETRDVVQTIYMRRVEKIGGKLVNVEFDKVENVKDPVKEAMKKKK